MKKALALILVLCALCFTAAGCGEDDENSGTPSVTETEPMINSITVEQFAEVLGASENYTFSVEVNDTSEDLSIFPYEGLQSCALVTVDNVSVASFMVFDSADNAQKILTDAKAGNVEDYSSETGKNFDKASTGTSVIERVDSTVLTVSANDSGIVNEILSLTKY